MTVPTEEREVGAERRCSSDDRGRQPGDLADLGRADLVDQPPGVRGDGLEVAALRLGVDGAEGERGLARAGDPGEHDQHVARDVHVDAAQIVLPGAAHPDVRVVGAVHGGGLRTRLGGKPHDSRPRPDPATRASRR